MPHARRRRDRADRRRHAAAGLGGLAVLLLGAGWYIDHSHFVFMALTGAELLGYTPPPHLLSALGLITLAALIVLLIHWLAGLADARRGRHDR